MNTRTKKGEAKASLFYLVYAGLEPIKMHHAGGILLPPVQTLVATLIFAKGKNANRVRSPAPKHSSPNLLPMRKGFGLLFFVHLLYWLGVIPRNCRNTFVKYALLLKPACIAICVIDNFVVRSSFSAICIR